MGVRPPISVADALGRGAGHGRAHKDGMPGRRTRTEKAPSPVPHALHRKASIHVYRRQRRNGRQMSHPRKVEDPRRGPFRRLHAPRPVARQAGGRGARRGEEPTQTPPGPWLIQATRGMAGSGDGWRAATDSRPTPRRPPYVQDGRPSTRPSGAVFGVVIRLTVACAGAGRVRPPSWLLDLALSRAPRIAADRQRTSGGPDEVLTPALRASSRLSAGDPPPYAPGFDRAPSPSPARS
jgi:hypothetical protein